MKTLIKYGLGIIILFTASGFIHAQTPGFAWVKKAGGGGSGASDMAMDVAGNIYTTGAYVGGITFGSASLSDTAQFIGKHDAQGNCVWLAKVCTHGASLRSSNIILDNQGHLYVSGTYYNSDSVVIAGTRLTKDTSVGAAYMRDFVAKYDTSGNAIWGFSLPDPYGNQNPDRGIAVDDSGNVYINKYNISKISGNGTLVWSDYFTDTIWSPRSNLGSGIAVDAAGNVYTSGYLILAKRNNNGDSLWKINEPYYTPAPAAVYGVSVVAGDSGYVYVSGAFSYTVNFGSETLVSLHPDSVNMFIAKYDSSGNNIWARRAGCGKLSDSYINSSTEIENTTLGSSNEIIISGSIQDSAYFGSQILTGTGPFIAAYDAGGDFLWAKVASYGTGTSSGSGYASGVKTDTSGNIYIAGGFGKTLHFDTISVTSTIKGSMYIAKLAPSTTSVGSKAGNHNNTGGNVSSWPNPAQQFLNVQIENEEYKQIGLYDQLGRQVYSSSIEKGQNLKSINIGKIANGIYYLRLSGDYGSETKKIIIQQ